MIADLSAVSAILLLGTPILLLVMLLPSVIELKRPRDAGPRLITDTISALAFQMMRVTPLVNIEEDQAFDARLVQPISSILSFLPKLDA